MTIPSYPGVFLEPSPPISSTQVGGIDEFKALIVVGTKGTTGTGTEGKLTEIKSHSDFRAKFGDDSPSTAAIKVIFDNYSQIATRKRLWFIAGKATTTPTAKTNLIAALDILSAEDELPLGILISPEMLTISVEADFSAVCKKMDTVAKTKGLLAMLDMPDLTITADLAVVFADEFRAATRSSALYYGWNAIPADTASGMAQGDDVGTATIAAAHAIRCWDELGQFVPPAGKYAIAHPNFLTPPPPINADQEKLYPARINYPKKLTSSTGQASYTIWGTRMASEPDTTLLSVNEGCLDINTYVASVVTEKTIQRNIDVFRSTGFDSVSMELKSTVSNRMSELSSAGAFKQNVTVPQDILIQTERGLETITKGTDIARGYIVFEPFIKGNQAFIDVVYFPVTTLEQIIIRVSRIII